jgi:hypothetical protein
LTANQKPQAVLATLEMSRPKEAPLPPAPSQSAAAIDRAVVMEVCREIAAAKAELEQWKRCGGTGSSCTQLVTLPPTLLRENVFVLHLPRLVFVNR